MTALACGGTKPAGASTSADGSAIAFALCSGEGARDALEPGRCAVARWTAGAGTESLVADAQPRGISADGQVVLIQAQTASLWSAASGLLALPLQTALALSDDGRVVLGELPDPQNALGASPARWTASNGAQPIAFGPLPEAVLGVKALTLSGDGRAVVGFLFDATFLEPVAPQALDIFRWSETGGIVRTGARYVPVAAPAAAVFISTDGARISGVLDPTANPRSSATIAFHWTEAEGVVELTTSTGNPHTGQLFGSSASGERLLSQQDTLPVLWEQARGFWRLDEALGSAGVPLDGWLLQEPLALSRDGHVVVGTGYCDGLPAVYRAVVPD